MEEPAPRDRRIGGRVDIEPIDVAWLTMSKGGGGLLRRSRPEPVELPGRIVNVSATGAGIEGPRLPELVVGGKASIIYAGRRSVVIIRRVGDTDRAEVAYYGVELEHMHPNLREAVFDIVGKGRPGEETWRRAW